MINPEIRQLVTVFGRVISPSGALAANVDIHNHIGKTRTDSKGEFAMDIDKKFPFITLLENNGETCEVELDLTAARGAVWVGEVQCIRQRQISKRNQSGAEDVY